MTLAQSSVLDAFTLEFSHYPDSTLAAFEMQK